MFSHSPRISNLETQLSQEKQKQTQQECSSSREIQQNQMFLFSPQCQGLGRCVCILIIQSDYKPRPNTFMHSHAAGEEGNSSNATADTLQGVPGAP